LKFVTAHQYKLDSVELALQVNGKFHGGTEVRSQGDIKKIVCSKTIFNKGKRR